MEGELVKGDTLKENNMSLLTTNKNGKDSVPIESNTNSTSTSISNSTGNNTSINTNSIEDSGEKAAFVADILTRRHSTVNQSFPSTIKFDDENESSDNGVTTVSGAKGSDLSSSALGIKTSGSSLARKTRQNELFYVEKADLDSMKYTNSYQQSEQDGQLAGNDSSYLSAVADGSGTVASGASALQGNEHGINASTNTTSLSSPHMIPISLVRKSESSSTVSQASNITSESRDMLQRVLRSHFLFKGTSKENLRKIANAMGRFSVSPNCEIIHEGDPGDNLYVLESGELVVTQSNTPNHVDILRGNRVFGELALIYDYPRAATVAAGETGAVTWYLSKQQFRHLSTQFMNENIQKRITTLRSIPVFANLTDAQLHRVGAVMQEERFKPGQVICTQGERLVPGVNDKFYTIVQGSVQVNVNAPPPFSPRHIHAESRSQRNSGPLLANENEPLAKKSRFSGSSDVNSSPGMTKMIDPLPSQLVSGQFAVPTINSASRGKVPQQIITSQPPSISSSLPSIGGPPRSNSVQAMIDAKSQTQSQQNALKRYSSSPALYSNQDLINGELPAVGNSIISLDVLDEGDWFGEVALLRNEPRSANVIALGKIKRTNSSENIKFGENGDNGNSPLKGGKSRPSSEVEEESSDAPVDNDTVCYTLSRGAFEQILQTSASAQETIEKKKEVRNAGNNELILRHQRNEEAASITLLSLKKIAIIGEGGFSVVRMVIHEPTGDAYALKVMNKMDLLMRNQTEHVNNERKILKAVSHSFILSLIKTFQDDHKVYMLLELVQGGELFSRVLASRGVLQLNHVLFYSANILEGLSYLHRKRIAYRDLKLENLVVAADGYLKVSFFDIYSIIIICHFILIILSNRSLILGLQNRSQKAH